MAKDSLALQNRILGEFNNHYYDAVDKLRLTQEWLDKLPYPARGSPLIEGMITLSAGLQKSIAHTSIIIGFSKLIQYESLVSISARAQNETIGKLVELYMTTTNKGLNDIPYDTEGLNEFLGKIDSIINQRS